MEGKEKQMAMVPVGYVAVPVGEYRNISNLMSRYSAILDAVERAVKSEYTIHVEKGFSPNTSTIECSIIANIIGFDLATPDDTDPLNDLGFNPYQE